MRLLRKKHDNDAPPPEGEAEASICEHITLVPRWDNIDDIGHADRATTYRCEACGVEFSPADATRLRETEAARIQRRIAS